MRRSCTVQNKLVNCEGEYYQSLKLRHKRDEEKDNTRACGDI